MQSHKIRISATPSMELLERILRVIRHRGGEISNLTAYKEKNLFQLEVEFYSTRTTEYITNQIQKIVDIKMVEQIVIENKIKLHG